MPQKPKLTIPEQIAYMRDQCGIAFSRCSEDEAAAFLSHRNYFFKVKSFAKNYTKDANGKYLDLDFAYLQELSILDALLRKQILAIALDVEHFLKVGLMAEISQIESFVSRVPELKKSKSRKTKLANPVIHDFVALLFLFDRVCTSPSAKRRVYAGLTDLLEGRFQQHSDYFQQNAVLVSSYEFVRKIVHFLQENQA